MQHPVVVVSFVSGEWVASVEAGAARQTFNERYPALEWAHRWAQSHRPSLVRVLRQDGIVEDEWAYGAFKGIRRMGPADFQVAAP
jgi:Uncharacterized protein conserved in bacteria (DUF2188)